VASANVSIGHYVMEGPLMPRPNGRDPSTNPAAFLGSRLRQARIDAGFKSQDALAAKLGFDRTVVTKAETGERPPTDDVLTAWLTACGISGIPYEWVAALARRGDALVPTWFEGWLDAEREARMLKYWQPIIIPGLFQTADYARALLVAGQSDTSDEAIEELVTARLARRAVFDKPEPPNVVVLLDETVLHRMIGSPQVMHDQLIEVADMSVRPYISVEVVPAGSGANAGLGGALNIASGDGSPDVVHMDAVEGQTTEERVLVRKAEVAFDRVRGDALSRGQSRDLILRLADELWKA
jgi:transcriptional regulator with XRE-family HTH domain